jgi:hypothetical protein
MGPADRKQESRTLKVAPAHLLVLSRTPSGLNLRHYAVQAFLLSSERLRPHSHGDLRVVRPLEIRRGRPADPDP